MRTLMLTIVAALAAVVLHAGSAQACVRASEANTLLGVSADGKYALLALVRDDGAMDHAEILPTAYQGFVYVVTEDEDARQILVTKVKVGQCADFGDEDSAIVEKKRGTLTEATLRGLKTVKAMKFAAPSGAAPAALPTARFTGAKRYAAHDLEITDGATTTTLPVPVWCVGSCMADEHWQRWKANVTAVHTTTSGAVLYEVHLDEVCNAGTLIRLIAAVPAKKKAPRLRCTGSGG